MHATTEIDKAGRIVVPKKLRDALHLVPGSKLSLQQVGDHLVMQAEQRPRGLYMKKGTWVYDPGVPCSVDILDWIEKDRKDREQAIVGDWLKL